jgi:tetratricopeptide (TPR) repeat protein
MKDFYAVLEITKTASLEEIKASYRFLAKFYHPDVNEGTKKQFASRKMAEINEAYEILGDPSKRAAYDQEYNQVFGVSMSSQDDAARMAYKSAQEMVALIQNSGFIEGFLDKVREYRDRAVRQLDTVVITWPSSYWAICAQRDIMILLATVEPEEPVAAREAARKLGRMAPKTDVQDLATLVIAKTYNDEGNPDKAIELLAALEHSSITPECRPEAAFGIAEIYRTCKCDLRTALNWYERFLNSYPSHEYCAAVRYTMGRILDSDLKEYQQAIAMYQQVLQLHPHSEEAGDCQWRIDYIHDVYGVPRLPRETTADLSPAAYLVGLNGSYVGKRFCIRLGLTHIIGRCDNADISLANDPTVSLEYTLNC